MRSKFGRIRNDADAMAALDLRLHEVRHMTKQASEGSAQEVKDGKWAAVVHRGTLWRPIPINAALG
jgi:hypothetical protein